MIPVTGMTLALLAAGLAAGLALTEAAPAAPPANPEVRGKLIFMRCAACHALNASAPAKTGPHLQGIMGRKAASVATFSYSPSMRSSNVTWNEATMDKWLTKPRTVVPGTTMIFPGMADAAQRKALIAYLKKPTP